MKKTKNNTYNYKNRKLKMFSIFLGLSLFFWFLSKLSKEYITVVKFKTNYINFSNDKMLQSKPIEELNLTIKSQGFSLLSYNLKKTKLTIDLNDLFKLNNGKYYYLTSGNLSNLQSQIQAGSTIINVKPDTLYFDLGILKVKEVKVEPLLKLIFKKGFNLTEEIKVEPEFITITGPEKQIDSIKKVITDEIIINKINNNFEKTIQLKPVEKVKYSNDNIKIIAKVEKFTEGKLILNFNIINIPKDLNVSSFTRNLEITYKVSLKNFDKVFAKDFELVCDFSKTQKDTLTYLIPEFLRKSPLVSGVKINTTKIEYLIKK